MGLIITFLAVVLMALVFQRNSFLGIFVVVLYVWYKYRKSKFYFNRLKMRAESKKTQILEGALQKGFDGVCKELKKLQGLKGGSETDIMGQARSDKIPQDEGVYKY